MAFPIKTCVVCGEEFELRPDKPGFANRCPVCSEPENENDPKDLSSGNPELDAERRKAIREMLYRKES
jgi:predicted nucleic acid-binding Zn ribbon protein